MKGKIATLLGATSAFGFLAGNAVAHPGHSPSDVTAQLSAPLAGSDHLAAFIVAGVLGLLAAARLGARFAQSRRQAARTTRR